MARGSRTRRPTDEAKERAEAAVAKLERSVKFLVTDYTVEFLAGKLRDEEYYVPNYQRGFIWKDAAQSRFIESLLMGLPIPFLFLWQADDGRLEIVDGSQRMRTMVRFLDDDLALSKLDLLPELDRFRFSDLERSRQRKLESRTVRGIVLDNSVTARTRTEMFYRINTGGTLANDAEVRRGSLPGPFMDLVVRCAEFDRFVAMTPIDQQQVRSRAREELAVRFFTYLERMNVGPNGIDMPGWNDRPREYIWDFVEGANRRAEDEPGYVDSLETEFRRMLEFVDATFPNGFRKSPTGRQVPRVRFEAIAVGSAAALREQPRLVDPPRPNATWVDGKEFAAVTTSDAANVKSKLLGRIRFVLERLTQ